MNEQNAHEAGSESSDGLERDQWRRDMEPRTTCTLGTVTMDMTNSEITARVYSRGKIAIRVPSFNGPTDHLLDLVEAVRLLGELQSAVLGELVRRSA